jgi:DNA-binding CsgD family transcriptional regulator
MSHSQRIRTDDISALLRLGHELHDLAAASHNPIERHEHMLRGLVALLGARYAVSSVARIGPGVAGQAQLLMFVYHGWDDDYPQRRQTANEYLRTLAPTNPACAPLRRLLQSSSNQGDVGQTPITRTRQQLVDDTTWYASEYVQHVHRPMGADHALFSLLRMQGNGTAPGKTSPTGQLVTSLWIMRAWGERRAFEPRDSMLLRAFHSTAQWMFCFDDANADVPDTPRRNGELVGTPPLVTPAMMTTTSAIARALKVALSPRQKQTLRLLLNGDSEKQIATRLLRSRHTVHEHVKAIYRAVGVSSRAELLSRCLRRRW